MKRFVTVGDSFTEGLCDDLRDDGEYLGWADRVALALAPVQYANLAVRGKLLDQVVDEQVPAALAMEPDILTFHAGGNDVLRRGTDLQDLFSRYDAAVRDIAAPGRTVLLFTCLTRAGGSGRLADLLAQRFGEFNENVRRVGAAYGAKVVDIDAAPALTDRRLWFSDRLHLNSEGHKRVAAAVLEALGEPVTTNWRSPLPVASSNRIQDLGRDVAWIKDHFAPWIWRRVRGVSSGDGRVPKDTGLRLVEPA